MISYGYEVFKNDTTEETISNIKKWINKVIKKEKPEVFAIENVQFQKNPNVLIKLSMLLGVIENSFFEKEYLYFVVSPKTWKSFSNIKGKKREEQKKNTMALIKEVYGIDATEDECDAIGICRWTVNEVKTKIKR